MTQKSKSVMNYLNTHNRELIQKHTEKKKLDTRAKVKDQRYRNQNSHLVEVWDRQKGVEGNFLWEIGMFLSQLECMLYNCICF